MIARKYEIDMSKGSILKNMIMFAVPLMLSNILQHLYNAADQIVVGRWAGEKCLAAVGATGSITNLLTSLFLLLWHPLPYRYLFHTPAFHQDIFLLTYPH